MRTTSWISLTWFWMRPTWERRSEVVTLMSAAGPAARATREHVRELRLVGLARRCREPSERPDFSPRRDVGGRRLVGGAAAGERRVVGRTEGLHVANWFGYSREE